MWTILIALGICIVVYCIMTAYLGIWKSGGRHIATVDGGRYRNDIARGLKELGMEDERAIIHALNESDDPTRDKLDILREWMGGWNGTRRWYLLPKFIKELKMDIIYDV